MLKSVSKLLTLESKDSCIVFDKIISLIAFIWFRKIFEWFISLIWRGTSTFIILYQSLYKLLLSSKSFSFSSWFLISFLFRSLKEVCHNSILVSKLCWNESALKSLQRAINVSQRGQAWLFKLTYLFRF